MSNEIDLFKYLIPSQNIKNAVNDLEIFYQLTHQKDIKTYNEKSKMKRFSGTIGELFRFKSVEELMMHENKPWSNLLKSIFLLENYTSDVDMKDINKLSTENIKEFISLIKKGISAYDIIKDWISPLSDKKGVLQAIKDGAEVNIGNKFKVLQVAKLKNYKKKGEIFLFNDILDIENPDAFIYYLQYIKEEISDCLIVAIQRNKKYDFKGVFYLFLIYKGYLYNIDNSSGRLNFDNTEGTRNPDRYLERHYEDVWLPINLFFEVDIKRKIIVKGQNVFKIHTWDMIAKVSEGYLYWLNLFLFRIVDYISTNDILEGMTAKKFIPLLESSNKTIDFSYNTREWRGRNDYLLKIFKKNITTKALVLKKEE